MHKHTESNAQNDKDRHRPMQTNAQSHKHGEREKKNTVRLTESSTQKHEDRQRHENRHSVTQVRWGTGQKNT